MLIFFEILADKLNELFLFNTIISHSAENLFILLFVFVSQELLAFDEFRQKLTEDLLNEHAATYFV